MGTVVDFTTHFFKFRAFITLQDVFLECLVENTASYSTKWALHSDIVRIKWLKWALNCIIQVKKCSATFLIYCFTRIFHGIWLGLKQSVLLFIKSRFINTYNTLKITGSFFSQLFVLCFFSSPKAQKDKLFGERTRNHLFHVLQ